MDKRWRSYDFKEVEIDVDNDNSDDSVNDGDRDVNDSATIY